MKRRSALAVLASFPLVGRFFGRFAEARESVPEVMPDAMRKAASKHMMKGCHACAMVRTLNANLERHYAERGWTLPPVERICYRAVCNAMCHQLNDWELSEPYAKDPDIIPDVRFEAEWGDQRVFRKMKAKLHMCAMDDALHSDDVEMMNRAAEEVVIEIQMEIRHNPEPIEVYTLNVPPMMTPAMPNPKDFTVCRGRLSMAYSKS